MQTAYIQIIHKQSLSLGEIERIGYIQGLPWAGFIADAEDCESQIDGFDHQLEQARESSFEAGKQAGLGVDAAQQIADLENELTDLKASHQRCRNNLQAVYDWLRSDDCKTVKSRQAFEKRLLAALHVTPRY